MWKGFILSLIMKSVCLCWRRLLRESLGLQGDQSWVFIGRTDAEAETPNFGHLMWRVDSLEKILMLGGIRGRRRRGQQRIRWLDGIADSMGMSLSDLREFVMDREARRAEIHGVSKSWTWLSDWTELTDMCVCVWYLLSDFGNFQPLFLWVLF